MTHDTTSRRRWVIATVVALTLATAAGFGVAVAARDDSGTAHLNHSPWAQQCDAWAADSAASSTNCSQMMGWMTPHMMNATPAGAFDSTVVGTACRTWATHTSDPAASSAWCDQMMTWMSNGASPRSSSPMWGSSMMPGRSG